MYRKQDLIQAIKGLGIDPKGTVLIHSSRKAVGEVEGGAETILDAWIEYMRDGLLLFPTHTWDQIGAKKPRFDSRTEPSCVGILPELFRKRPGVVRSLHPTHSMAALGKDAAAFTEGEQFRDTPCPRNGCWGKLIDYNAEIVFLGCTLRSNTFIHGVEEWNHIPDRVSGWTQALTIVGPEGEEYQVAMHRHNCEACDDVSEHYAKLEAPFRKLGAIRYGTFGDAKCIIGNAGEMERITTALLQKEPNLFVDDKPVPSDWY